MPVKLDGEPWPDDRAMVKWFVAKNKPWRDAPTKWRLLSPEFRESFHTFEQALHALLTRRRDGAVCKIVMKPKEVE